MPLFLAKSGSAPAVLTKDGPRVVSYTLTADGAKQLRAAGLRNGAKVPSRVLVALIRVGNAHSPRLAEAQGQVSFEFADDQTSDLLPRCEMTGVTGDVHLVVYGEGNGRVAKLLGPEPRYVLQKATSLSVPVAIMTPASLAQLEAGNKVPLKSEAAATLRTLLHHDFDAAWEKLRQEYVRRQEVLPLTADGDLPLRDN